MYRVKAILADNRRVYHSRCGLIQQYTASMVQLLTSEVPFGAYTKDLCCYEAEYGSVFSKQITIPIVCVEVEHISRPIDPSAFVLGGFKAVETQN